MSEKKIRVLFIEENQDGTTGGSHFCMLDLVRELDKTKFAPTVMFYERNRLLNQFIESGAEVVIFNKPKPNRPMTPQGNEAVSLKFFKILFFEPMRILFNNLSTSLFPLLFFVFFLISRRIRIIHLNNSVFTFFEWVVAAKLTGRKIIAHQRSHFDKISPILNYHHRYYDYILGISDSTGNYLKKNGVKLENRYRTFYDRIDLNSFKARVTKSAGQIRSELAIQANAPVIGIVGNLQPWKGQLTMVKAVALLKDKYPDIVCLLIGDWSFSQQHYVDEIKAFSEEKGILEILIITGHRNDIPNLLTVMDLFIHASLSPEPFGMVVLEAMASRKAIIASNEGGPLEMIVDGQSGFLIPPGDPAILAEKIDFLLKNSDLRTEIGRSAYDTVRKKFSELDMDFIEKLYFALAKGKKNLS